MTSEATRVVARLLLAPSCMVALGILVKGYADTGDGFSAGVVVSLGILMQFVAFGPEVGNSFVVVRLAPRLAVAGLLISLIVTFAPVLRGDPVLTHWPGPGESVVHLGSLELLSAVVFDIGVFLVVTGFIVGVFSLIARSIQRQDAASR